MPVLGSDVVGEIVVSNVGRVTYDYISGTFLDVRQQEVRMSNPLGRKAVRYTVRSAGREDQASAKLASHLDMFDLKIVGTDRIAQAGDVATALFGALQQSFYYRSEECT